MTNTSAKEKNSVTGGPVAHINVYDYTVLLWHKAKPTTKGDTDKIDSLQDIGLFFFFYAFKKNYDDIHAKNKLFFLCSFTT